MDMKKPNEHLYFHVHEMYINLEKFDIDRNNDESLKTIWKHKKKKKLIVIGSAHQCKAQIVYNFNKWCVIVGLLAHN